MGTQRDKRKSPGEKSRRFLASLWKAKGQLLVQDRENQKGRPGCLLLPQQNLVLEVCVCLLLGEVEEGLPRRG